MLGLNLKWMEWKPQPNWIDWIGVVLGFCWIGLLGLLTLAFRI
jgi:hypothetical protein